MVSRDTRLGFSLKHIEEVLENHRDGDGADAAGDGREDGGFRRAGGVCVADHLAP